MNLLQAFLSYPEWRIPSAGCQSPFPESWHLLMSLNENTFIKSAFEICTRHVDKSSLIVNWMDSLRRGPLINEDIQEKANAIVEILLLGRIFGKIIN